MRRSSFFRSAAVAICAALLASTHAFAAGANAWPERTIRVVVGYAAGGSNDIVARALSQKLSERLGHSVVVENRTGAGGMIGAEYVAKAPADGYTLLFAPSSVFTTNPVMYTKLPYSLSDFAPISSVVTYPFFVIVSNEQPIHSMKELTGFIKAHPDKANFGGAAGIFQLGFELFKSQTGTTGEYIGYKGTNHSVNAVIGGEILMTMADGAPTSVALQSGKVRALAVTADRRARAYPDVPTVAETGYPALKMGSWMGLFAPAATPPAIVKKLEEEVGRIVGAPEFAERMSTLQVNAEAIASGPFGEMITADLDRWRAVAKAGNIQPIQ